MNQQQVTVGAPVYTPDGDQLGEVKEVRGRYFKVDTRMAPDYWLRLDAVRSVASGRVTLAAGKDQLDEYRVTDPDDEEVTERNRTDTTTTTRREGTDVTAGAVRSSDTSRGTNRQPADARSDDARRRAELREERLRPETEQVEAGRVGLRKEVVTEQQTVDVPVTREQVYVERRDVGERPASGPVGEDESIEVPVSAERARLEKETVVTGEVELGKRQVQETERVTGEVRREEARATRDGEVDVQGHTTDTTPRTDRRDTDPTTR